MLKNFEEPAIVLVVSNKVYDPCDCIYEEYVSHLESPTIGRMPAAKQGGQGA